MYNLTPGCNVHIFQAQSLCRPSLSMWCAFSRATSSSDISKYYCIQAIVSYCFISAPVAPPSLAARYYRGLRRSLLPSRDATHAALNTQHRLKYARLVKGSTKLKISVAKVTGIFAAIFLVHLYTGENAIISQVRLFGCYVCGDGETPWPFRRCRCVHAGGK